MKAMQKLGNIRNMLSIQTCIGPGYGGGGPGYGGGGGGGGGGGASGKRGPIIWFTVTTRPATFWTPATLIPRRCC